MMLPRASSSMPGLRSKWKRSARGSLLLEVSVALGAAAMLALMLMKASLLAVSGNQWTSLQTLSDAVLTRETALANRIPFASITAENSLWKDATVTVPTQTETIVMGRQLGGVPVTGKLIRFRVNASDPLVPEVNLSVWRLHSILRYKVGEHEYVKSCSTMRVQ